MPARIPVINLEKFASDNAADRANVIGQLRKGLEEVGFLMITGHGVQQSLIDRVNEASLKFFDRPHDEKMEFASKVPGSRGYSQMRGRTVGIIQDPTLLKSLQESYGVGPITIPDDPWYRTKLAGHTYAENIWPDEPVDFKPAISAYYVEMDRLFHTMMRMFAIGLGLPEDYFESKIDKHASTFRLTHYPALEKEPLPGEQRAGAHTDIGCLTLLHIDDTPNSLQVQLRSGEWIFVNRVPDAFVVNIGDLMMRWTNDKWVSNTHRVVNPPFVNGRSERRLSLVYFCQTNYDAVVECLPNCAEAGKLPRHPPIVSGEFSAMRSAIRYGYDAKALEKVG